MSNVTGNPYMHTHENMPTSVLSPQGYSTSRNWPKAKQQKRKKKRKQQRKSRKLNRK